MDRLAALDVGGEDVHLPAAIVGVNPGIEDDMGSSGGQMRISVIFALGRNLSRSAALARDGVDLKEADLKASGGLENQHIAYRIPLGLDVLGRIVGHLPRV